MPQLSGGGDIAVVVSVPDDPEETQWYASVAATAADCGLNVIAPAEPDAAGLERTVEGLQPDFIFSFYYRSLLPEALLDCARRGALNMHGSLLPKYRGRAPVNWAILKGERETGATLHYMVARPDAGRIVDQERVPIGPNQTAVEAVDKVSDAAETVLKGSLPHLLARTRSSKK